MNSAFLKLNLMDFGKGLLVAIITAAFNAVFEAVKAGGIPADMRALATSSGSAAVLAGMAYLSKNLLSNSSGEIATPEPVVPAKSDNAAKG